MNNKEQLSQIAAETTKYNFDLPVFSFIGKLVKKLEFEVSKWCFIQYHYFKLFYRKVIDNEFLLSDLKPGDNVVHIGSGPLPLTAIYLAERGCIVKAIDNDHEAVEVGRHTLKNYNSSENISIDKEDGLDANLSKAEAVFVSLHVLPRKKVLKKVFSALKQDGKLIYRNPRGFLSFFYPCIDPADICTTDICTSCSIKRVRQSFGKVSLVITKS